MDATDHTIINMLGVLMGFAVLGVGALWLLSIQVIYLTSHIKKLEYLASDKSKVEAGPINQESADSYDNLDQTRETDKSKGTDCK